MNWRRSPAIAAPDRPADRGGCRPAHRCDGRCRGGLRRALRRAPRPCRAGAGIRIRAWSVASSRMVATVSALWVANCGKIRGRSASNCLRAGDVVQIGHRLAGEHGIAVEPAFLRALDLGVPIGALDQPHHHPAVEAACETIDVIDHVAGALLIGLDRQAKAVPARQRCIAERCRDHVERQFQPVGFLGIDGEIEVMGFGLPGEIDQARDQFASSPARGSPPRSADAMPRA